MAATSEPPTPEPDYRSYVPSSMSSSQDVAATQLDFYQAMADFKHMFPNMDEEVIEAVLRSNQGAVDATIDQLLTMNTDINKPAATHNGASRQRKERAEKRPKESKTCDSGPPPYSVKAGEQPPSYRDCTDQSSQAGRQNSIPRSRRTESFLLDAPVPSAEEVGSPRSNGSGGRDMFGAVGGDVSLLSEGTTPKHRLPEGDIAFEDPPRPVDPPPAPMPQIPDKMPLFNHDYTPRHQLTPKRLYKNWNPPLLGRLPEDFLRISISSPNPGTECHHCHHHPHVHSSPTSVSSQHASTMPVHRSKGRSPHSRSSSQASSPRLGSVEAKSPRLSPRNTRSEELSSELIQQKMAENERKRSSFSGDSNPAMLQMLEDERLALMIQNEEFLAELMGDEEFMSALERDHMNATAFQPSQEDDPIEAELDPDRPNAEFIEGYGDDRDMTLGAFPFERPVPKVDKDSEFRRKLNNMGGTTKKKMIAAAKRFFSRKKRPSKQLYPYPGYELPIQLEGYEALNNEHDYPSLSAHDMFGPQSSDNPPHLQYPTNPTS